MESSGDGLTFTDHDVKMIRNIVGLLSRAKYADLDAPSIVEASRAFQWINDLVPLIKDNVKDFSQARIVDTNPPPAEAKSKKSKK